jgi:PAS domain S-box-containing protein
VVVIALLLGVIGVHLVMRVRRLTRAERGAVAAKASARAADAQYRLIAENVGDMIVLGTPDFVREYVSPGCRDLLGYEPEELIGGTPHPLVHPDDADRVAAFGQNMVAVLKAGYIVCRMRHRDGHWIWVESSLKVLRDPDTGVALNTCAAIRDITRRVAAETALRESERELERSNAERRAMALHNLTSQYARGLLEASLDPLVTISPEGKIVDANEATSKVTGVSREDLAGTDFSGYFTDPRRARDGYREAFAKGSIVDYRLTIRNRNEDLTDVLYNASVYKDAQGEVLGLFAAARDTTAQRRAERESAERRGKELEKLEELEHLQRLTVRRELQMIDLKKEIQALREALASREIGGVAE